MMFITLCVYVWGGVEFTIGGVTMTVGNLAVLTSVITLAVKMFNRVKAHK